MVRILLILACSVISYTSEAAYHVFSRPSKQPGLWGLLSYEEKIDAFFFKSSTHGITIADEGNHSPRYGSLEAAMKDNHCEAGINGGYFAADKQRTPIGLLRHQGTTLHKLATGAFTVAGILYDTGYELKLERSTQLSTPVKKMQEAIQGGPFLIEKGAIVNGLDNKKLARRTFIATDGKGNWCIAVTSPLTLRNLAILLSKNKTLGKFKPQTALNLDGGTSSSIWVATPRVYRAPFKEVRNYVGIIRRTTPTGTLQK